MTFACADGMHDECGINRPGTLGTTCGCRCHDAREKARIAEERR